MTENEWLKCTDAYKRAGFFVTAGAYSSDSDPASTCLTQETPY